MLQMLYSPFPFFMQTSILQMLNTCHFIAVTVHFITEKCFCFKFLAFEESGMLESDEVLYIPWQKSANDEHSG